MTKRIRFALLLLAVSASPAVSGKAVAEQARHGKIADMRGEVMVRQDGGEWKPAQIGALLSEKDEVKTSSNAFAEIVLDEGEVGSLELKENSLFRVNTLTTDKTGDKVTLLDLAIGKVLVHAEKLRGDSKFEVRTPTSTTGVRGTEFEVSVEEQS